MTKDEQKIFDESLSRFSYCTDAESISRNFQRDDLKFYAGSPDNGYQWPARTLAIRESDPSGSRPCLTINKLPQHVHQITNEQRQNRPAIKVLPVDDKADPEMAEKFNGIIRHIEYISDADIAYDTACERQVVHGEGYWRVMTDYVSDDSFDQEIYIKRIRNSFTVHIDPDCQDPCGADAKYGFIDELLTEEEFKRKYPKANPISWDNGGQDEWYSNWFIPGDKKLRVAEYFYLDYEKKTLFLWDDGEITEEKTREPNFTLMVEPQLVKERTVQAKKWKYCKLYGDGILETREWASAEFPIIRVIGNEFDVDGQVTFTGLVRNAKDAQRMYNYWTSQEAEMLALAPKSPFVGAAGQFEGFETKWDQANVKNYAYLEYNPVIEGGHIVPPPQRQAPPMPSAGILQAKSGMSEDIKATTAQYDPSLGMRKGNQSGIAIKQLQREGDVANFHYTDNLGRAIRQTGRILIDLIPKIYDARRIARILDEDGTPDQVIIDQKINVPVQPIMQENKQTGKMEEIARLYNPSIGRYDVVVTSGPSYMTKRQEAAAAMSEMTQANPALWNIIGDLLVKNMDWPGADDMAKRLRATLAPEVLKAEDGEKSLPPEAQQALQQAQQAMQLVEQKGKELQEMEMQLKDESAKTVTEKAALDSSRSQLAAEKRVLDADYARVRAELKAAEAQAACDEANKFANETNESNVKLQQFKDGVNSDSDEKLSQMQDQICQQIGMLAQQLSKPKQKRSTIRENEDGTFSMESIEE